jgi:hypothetical protein
MRRQTRKRIANMPESNSILNNDFHFIQFICIQMRPTGELFFPSACIQRSAPAELTIKMGNYCKFNCNYHLHW